MSVEELIDKESERMWSEFIEISSKYKTPSEVAYHREEIVRTFCENTYLHLLILVREKS